ncbi:transposase [Candidatus Mycobacterium methanotrophicum]|uniref:transposase n=1 Tax=Candidatus Mycobacterium methanotrophicum TaxID=2943498 RepID=UPI003512F2EA
MQHPLDHGLSNARSEATNTHLRTLTKRAYGFHSPDDASTSRTTPARNICASSTAVPKSLWLP